MLPHSSQRRLPGLSHTPVAARAWGSTVLCLTMLSAMGCGRRNLMPDFILPEKAAIARSAAYSTMPPYQDGFYPSMTHEMGHRPPDAHGGYSSQGQDFTRSGPQSQFVPLPNYFPDDGPQLQPAPQVELAPPPPPADIQQMSGTCCCQRCERLTAELAGMSQRVDELSAMMETQRLTIESLNAALLRADANIQQLHDDVAWHRGELDRVRITMQEQQQRDYERLSEIAEIVDRLSQTP